MRGRWILVCQVQQNPSADNKVAHHDHSRCFYRAHAQLAMVLVIGKGQALTLDLFRTHTVLLKFYT